MKNFVVVLGTMHGQPVYLGELEPRLRQGVAKLENACRFTAVGALRVASSYSGATVMKVSCEE